jgi:hypothetical protein
MVNREIQAADSKGQLKGILVKRLEQYAVAAQPKLLSAVEPIVQDIHTISMRSDEEFVRLFLSRYQSLQAIDECFKLPKDRIPRLTFVTSVDFSQKPADLVLSPADGIGKWLWRSLFGPKLPQLKNDAILHCRDKLQRFFADCEVTLDKELNSHVEKTWKALENSIDRYSDAYHRAISRMISRMESEESELQKFRRQTQDALDKLDLQLQEIGKTREILKQHR